MTRCPSCSTDAPADSRFCRICGTGLPANGDATVVMPHAPASPLGQPSSGQPSSRLRVSSASGFNAQFDSQRFPPGTLVGSRYRIISRLGKGGMGEVFRADDLILGQPVALKFLPDEMAGNVNLLTRFYDEVRIARQVTHANVCRVYDIGEQGGQPYLSMEYVDGEDLGALLRRIGRFPPDKALEVARKLCAGLAAAHAQGVLHRDLKPANVMIDARGQILIMDFGLAGLADHLKGAEIRNGTPAYMAPEQLTGSEVSVRSDIYALGLVLYEIFTGKQPFEAATLADIIRVRQDSTPKSLSSHVHDLDPAVERVILQCLNPDPNKRPASALAVSAALPGGDPLAAALAAGETPSPEMVAAAGQVEGLDPKWAITALAGVVVALATLLGLIGMRPWLKLAFDNPPEVLQQKAREIIQAAGYTERPADSAGGFRYADDYEGWLESKLKGIGQWEAVMGLRPSPVQFWYRQSPRALRSVYANQNGQVDSGDPPMAVTGMVSAVVDLQGRLLSFEAVPPQYEPAGTPGPAYDWSALFQAAGLDLSKLQTATPEWTPLSAVDARMAWTGTYPGRPGVPLRVEAAAWRGRPVFFEVLGPWAKPTRMEADLGSVRERLGNLLLLVMVFTVAAIGILMARTNARAGRGDSVGARRLALVVFTAVMIRWTLVTHHVPFQAGELGLFGEAIGHALMEGGLVWVLYLAVEPWVRRRWPQTLVTWSRVLAGRFRDPLVGRDILFSVLFGLGYLVVIEAVDYASARTGNSPPSPERFVGGLMGLRYILGMYVTHAELAIQAGPGLLLQIFLLRVLLKKEWLAAAGFVLFWTCSKALSSTNPMFDVPLLIFVYVFLVVILMRYGLFALTLTAFLLDGTSPQLRTLDLTAWYGLSSTVAILVVLGLAFYGFHTSLGGRKLFGDGLLNR